VTAPSTQASSACSTIAVSERSVTQWGNPADRRHVQWRVDAVAATEATGSAALSFVVPALAAGAHSVVALDDKRQYPLHLGFQIQ
jgi:hypothetical protein